MMEFIFIRSTATVVSPEEAKHYQRVYVKNFTLVSGTVKVFELLAPSWFWVEGVKFEGAASKEVAEWVNRQAGLKFLHIQDVLIDKGSFVADICHGCILSSVSTVLEDVCLENLKWNRQEVHFLARLVEFSSVLKSLSMSQFQPTKEAEPFLPGLWLKISKIKSWDVIRREISPRECTAMAFSFSSPDLTPQTEGIGITTSSTAEGRSSLHLLISGMQRQPHMVSLSVRVPNLIVDQRDYLQRCLGALAYIWVR